MFCSRCGTSLAEGATFCTKCGAPIGKFGSRRLRRSRRLARRQRHIRKPERSMPPPGAVPMVMVPAVPYAGFWLRFVAYLLDVIIVGIVAVPIVVVLAVATGASAALSSMVGRQSAAGSCGRRLRNLPLLAVYYSPRRIVALLFSAGEFELAGYRREKSAGVDRDGSGWQTSDFWASDGAIFFAIDHGPRAALHWLYPRRNHSEEAGVARHDRGNFGAAEELAFPQSCSTRQRKNKTEFSFAFLQSAGAFGLCWEFWS